MLLICNGVLEGMQKTWHAPEVQLLHKIANLQNLLYLDTPPDAPSIVSETFVQLKSVKVTQVQEVIDPLTIYNYERGLFCNPYFVCSLKTSQHASSSYP